MLSALASMSKYAWWDGSVMVVSLNGYGPWLIHCFHHGVPRIVGQHDS